ARIGVTRQPAIRVAAFRASVHCEDQRIFLSLLLVEGSEEQSFQLEAVPRLEPNRLLRSEPLGREPGIARRQLPRLPLALRPKKALGGVGGTLAGKRRRALAGEIESKKTGTAGGKQGPPSRAVAPDLADRRLNAVGRQKDDRLAVPPTQSGIRWARNPVRDR